MREHLVGRRRLVITVTSGVAVVAAATSAWALSGTSGPAYRLATAGRGSVQQSLTTTGAIGALRESNLNFQVAGTVGRVRVTAGRHVHAGQTLARLDRSALRAAVDSARSTLSQARASLVSDETTQTSTASTGSTTARSNASPTPTTSATTSPHGSGPTTGTSTTIAHEQQTVVAAQRQSDQDLATARTALKAAKAACASELSPDSGDRSAVGSAAEATTACSGATSTVLADQTTVSSDQRAVADAEAKLAQTLGTASTTGADTTRTATATATAKRQTKHTAVSSPSTSTATAASTADAATPSTTKSVSASQLASDQATIDTDRATLATAKADLSQSVLRSPISGLVTAITVSKGDAVSTDSSSSGPAIRIVGSRRSQVTVDLSAAQVRTVTTGLAARVTPDGSAATVAGTVSSIALAPTTSSTGDSTYPVVITLSRQARSLVSGADAQVTIRLSTAHNVTTVPTSAVHRSGSTTYVETLTDGKLVRRTVKVGAIGAALTEIRSGLSDGQRVVLANLDTAVPSSSTNLTSGSGLGSRLGSRTQFVGGGSGPVIAPPAGASNLGP